MTVKLDKTVPAISGATDRAPNQHRWYNADVTVTFACEDALSGIAECAPSTTITEEGALQSVVGTAVNNADNTASSVVENINIDQTALMLSGAAVTGPNAAGWYNDNVTIRWNAEDALSGIDPVSLPVDSTIVGEGEDLMATALVTDLAGNETSATSNPPVKIDRTSPQTNATAASGWNNVDVTVSLEATDALAGVKSTYYQLLGSAAQSGTSVTLSDEGIHTIAFWSGDYGGNIESAKRIQVKIDRTAPTIT